MRDFNFVPCLHGMIEIEVSELMADPELAAMAGATPFIYRTDINWELNHRFFVHLYGILANLDVRLRVAMGKDVFIPGHHRGFEVPSYHSYIKSLGDAVWYAVGVDYNRYSTPVYIVPYNEIYGGWRSKSKANEYRSGFVCSAMNIREYVDCFRDEAVNRMPPTNELMPDLYDDSTFGAWLNLLPQPVSLILTDRSAKLMWGAGEPRIVNSDMMGRYQLPEKDRVVETKCLSYRHGRALAYVLAWEKMAANEPADRHESLMRESAAEAERVFNARYQIS